MNDTPLLARLLLIRPARVQAALQRAERAGLVAHAPNLWQVSLGVLRMLHRTATRPESIGLSRDRAPLRTLAARLLRFRPLRAPLVIGIGAVTPWDLSGLVSSPETLIRHLVGTHHDRHQFAYDLQILALTEGGLERLGQEARTTRDGHDFRARLFRALCVFEGYHEALVTAAEHARRGDFLLDAAERADPDISFEAYLAWCRAQPETPAATLAALRDGSFRIDGHTFGRTPSSLDAAAA